MSENRKYQPGYGALTGFVFIDSDKMDKPLSKRKKKTDFKRLAKPKLRKFSKARLKSFNTSIRRSV